MPDLLIRNLDDGSHRELKRRATYAGRSLQSYVEQILTAHLARPLIEEWLDQLDQLEPVFDVTGSAALTEARDELP